MTGLLGLTIVVFTLTIFVAYFTHVLVNRIIKLEEEVSDIITILYAHSGIHEQIITKLAELREQKKTVKKTTTKKAKATKKTTKKAKK